MSNKQNILPIITLVLVVILGGIVLTQNKVAVKEKLGATAGPDISSPYFSFGGVQYWAAHSDSLVAATTTPFAAQSPVATSTLVSGGCYFDTSSTTASVVTFSKSATAFATTTAMGEATIAASAKGSVIASTTPASYTGVALDPTLVFAPSQWFVMSMKGGGGTFSPVGSCYAVWIRI